MLSTRNWDVVGKASRIKIMSTLLRTYEIDEVSFDIPKLSSAIGDEICLFIPRIASMLEANLQKRQHSFYVHMRCLCMFLMTNQGQELAESSPNIMRTLVQTLEYDQQQDNLLPRDKDLITALVMLKKVVALSEHLRKSLLRLRIMSLVSTLLQKVHWSDTLQEAGGNLLLDLASVDENSALALSTVFRKLLNSPQVYTKHSAIKMWTSILCTNSAVEVSLEGWEAEALEQLTRLLLCAPLALQYDVAELISLLLSSCHRYGELIPRLMKRCAAVLCLRYTLGGGPIVQPPLDWNMKFYAGYALEAPEVSEWLPEGGGVGGSEECKVALGTVGGCLCMCVMKYCNLFFNEEISCDIKLCGI
jgi:hypothetical protein